MDYIDTMYDICEALNKELEEANEKIKMSGGKMSAGDLELIDKISHAIKSIKTVIAMEESYSEDGRSYDDGFMRGSSYARGRGSQAKRDSMGRYTSRGYSRGRYSRDDARMEVKEQLEDIMMSAPDEDTKRMIRKWMKQIEE